jgi:hypothetical protein
MKIEFIPSSADVEIFVPEPRPAANYIPEWYRKTKNNFSEKEYIEKARMKRYLNNEVNPENIPSIKACTPFRDSMVNGYIQETWCDIYIHVEKSTEQIFYSYSTDPEIISMRNFISIESDVHYPIEFIWKIPWLPKLPNGYSALFTHPLNHFELPFMSTSGIIDSDDYYHVSFGEFPFYIKKEFSGIIPAGTPMYQIIPIKRDSWNSKKEKFDIKDRKKRSYEINKKFYNNYKRFFHKKKTFN